MTSWSWVPLTTIPGLPQQLTANFPYRIWGTTWSCSSQKSKIIQAYNFHFNCNPPLPPKWLLLGPPMHVDPYSSQHPNAGTQHANVMYIKNVALILDSFDKNWSFVAVGHLLRNGWRLWMNHGLPKRRLTCRCRKRTPSSSRFFASFSFIFAF